MLAWILLSFIFSASSEPDGTTTAVKFGESATLLCDAEHPSHDVYSLWKYCGEEVFTFYNGRVIKNKRNLTFGEEHLRKGNFSVTIESVQFSDEGNYECSVQRTEAENMKKCASIRLTVQGRSEHHKIPSGGDLTVNLFTGDDVNVFFSHNLICNVTNQVNLCTNPYNTRFTMMDKTLTLHKVKPKDQGNYTVKCSDSQKAINTVSLTVEGDGQPSDNKTQETKSSQERNSRCRIFSCIIIGISFLLLVIIIALLWLRRRKHLSSGEVMLGNIL